MQPTRIITIITTASIYCRCGPRRGVEGEVAWFLPHLLELRQPLPEKGQSVAIAARRARPAERGQEREGPLLTSAPTSPLLS